MMSAPILIEKGRKMARNKENERPPPRQVQSTPRTDKERQAIIKRKKTPYPPFLLFSCGGVVTVHEITTKRGNKLPHPHRRVKINARAVTNSPPHTIKSPFPTNYLTVTPLPT